MRRAGQVTLFIILGIMLLSGTLVLLYAVGQPPAVKETLLPQDVRSVLNTLKACEDTTVTTAVELQALQGGWLEPQRAVTMGPLAIGVGLQGTQAYLPAEEEMTDEFSRVVPRMLSRCVEDARADAQAVGIALQDADAAVSETFSENDVQVAIDHGVRVASGSVSAAEQPHTIVLRKRIKGLRAAAEQIVLQSLRDPGTIDTQFLFGLPYRAALLGMYGSFAVYSLTDTQADGTATFNVAVPIEQQEAIERFPRWIAPDVITIEVDKQYRGVVTAESAPDRIVRYDVDLPWLHIDPVTGAVIAMVDASFRGSHLATFTVTDSSGETAQHTVEVLVR